ncbi:MAG TPA: hypothetical protein VGM63_12150 [Mucilaginibacter sp.]|jgi:hypothetical protein
MKYINILLIYIAICFGCTSSTQKKSVKFVTSKEDSSNSNHKDSSNHNIANADTNSILPRTQADERAFIVKSYDKAKEIDSVFVNGSDTLHLHLKYFCLKESNLVIPKFYDENKENPKDFDTHEFASDIVLALNHDTILNKEFKASDFSPFFEDNFGGNLKKYGSLSMPYLSRRNKDKSHIVLVCPIAIPSTDIGLGLFLILQKNGNYQIVSEYGNSL